MPQYHFHVHDGRSESDPETVMLTDQSVAKVMAVTLAGEILQSEANRIVDSRNWSLEVTDDAGLALYRIEMRLSCPNESARDIDQALQTLVA
ncbi:DUF6894 family protein [Methylorubrum extorquens]